MPPHSRKIGDFLSFRRLDRADNLVEVLCPGYRFTDESSERWTAFVNRVKAKNPRAKNLAAALLKDAVSGIQLLNLPVAVVPILGSQDTSANPTSAVCAIASAIGELPSYHYCAGLLSKTAHRPLHNLRGAPSRDSEVEGKYKSDTFAGAGLPSVRCVLLVDDLVTRGTTMNDAARAIRAANSNVPVFGVALGKTERRGYWNGLIDNNHISQKVLAAAELL